MRIALLSVSAEMGGSEVSLLDLVKGLRRQAPSYELHLVVPRDGPLAGRARSTGACVHVLPMPASLASLGEPGRDRGAAGVVKGAGSLIAAGLAATAYQRQLRRLLVSISPDVVHTNGFKLHLLGTRAAAGRVAVVWHIHEYVSRRRLTRTLLRSQAGGVSAIVANSESVRADVIAAISPDVPVTRIYNAVDATEFTPDGPAADLDALAGLSAAPPGTVRIGLIATYGLWKGHEPFLEAMRLISGAQPVRGYIVGGALYDTAGSQYTRDQLAARIASAGLNGQVGLTGFLDRPVMAMRALDVVVHASTQPEPFGLVIAEAKTCGRAVIVSLSGGASELVTVGVDALAHRPGDVQGLADAMRSLATDAALRARLGRAAREAALRQFDLDEFARRFMTVYQASRQRVAA